MDTIKTLLEYANRLQNLCSGLPDQARKLPDDYASKIDSVRIEGDYYRPEKERIAAVNAIKKEIIERYRREGEQKRDERLSAIAVEIEQIRASICSAAAQAVIDAGVIARQIAKEAKGGDHD